MKKFAFTLGEVLIIVGIIGVVAMLTVPRATKNYRNKLYVTQLRKVYAQLSDAIQTSMLDEKASNFYDTVSSHATSCTDADGGICEEGAGYFLNKYFIPVKRNCTNTGKDACFEQSYKTITGANTGTLVGDYCIQLKSEATICMGNQLPGTTFRTINVDINGTKSPNISGRDIFYMKIEDNGVITDTEEAANCGGSSSAGCLQKIMDAGWRMEY